MYSNLVHFILDMGPSAGPTSRIKRSQKESKAKARRSASAASLCSLPPLHFLVSPAVASRNNRRTREEALLYWDVHKLYTTHRRSAGTEGRTQCAGNSGARASCPHPARPARACQKAARRSGRCPACSEDATAVAHHGGHQRATGRGGAGTHVWTAPRATRHVIEQWHKPLATVSRSAQWRG